MAKLNPVGTLVIGVALTLMMWGTMIPQARAQDAAAPAQVVSAYLTSLVNGDTQVLSSLIDGRMKRKSRALALDPESYALFLRKHYAGVQTTVEEIVPDGDRMLARVRFDYPTSDTSLIELIMTQLNGQWKITDETY